ncbi:MAG TPA: hypothetical protein PKM73_19730 [Verrucomicrobiota bacterium]|nr:hypothetical protein [Verrucomicrobiota bacterium]
MKRFITATIAGALLALGLATQGHAATVTIGFDGIALSQAFGGTWWDPMPMKEGGLSWQTGATGDRWEVIKMNDWWRSYYKSAVHAVSEDQAAYNGGTAGWAQSLWVAEDPWIFEGAYFLSWPNSDPAGATSVTVEGFLNDVTKGTVTINLSSTAWTYLDGTSLGAVDKVVVSDGVNHPWLMDDFKYNRVADGGLTAMLLGLGLVGLGGVRRMLK